MKKEKQEIQKGQHEQKNGISSLLTRNLFWLTVLFLGTPLVFQVGSFVSNGFVKGDFVVSGDWLGFWGGYLGIIPSGLIAYGVAKYQIDEDKKQQEIKDKEKLLPYFNMDENGIIFSTVENTLPLLNIDVVVYSIRDEGTKFYHSIGHKRPNEFFRTGPNQSLNSSLCDLMEPSEIDVHWNEGDKSFGIGKRMDISARLVDGRKIYFTYGDGVNGAHFVSNDEGGFVNYLAEENDDGKEESNKRAREYYRDRQ
ncbi:hypothetical protein [Weissella cibaria]|uniref:hypothetical protein n=1 Tax=Weissella cibaria TaxID=137591 RepID=UPI00106E5CBC|nr:hypothetical protein [Weissella cibaria]